MANQVLFGYQNKGGSWSKGRNFIYHNIHVIYNIHNMHTQSCLTLCDPMDWSPPGSSVHGIFQVRILEWVAMPSSRGFSWPRDQTCISCVSCIGRQILYCWTTWEAWEDVIFLCKINKNLWKSEVLLSGIYQVLVWSHFGTRPSVSIVDWQSWGRGASSPRRKDSQGICCAGGGGRRECQALVWPLKDRASGNYRITDQSYKFPLARFLWVTCTNKIQRL